MVYGCKFVLRYERSYTANNREIQIGFFKGRNMNVHIKVRLKIIEMKQK